MGFFFLRHLLYITLGVATSVPNNMMMNLTDFPDFSCGNIIVLKVSETKLYFYAYLIDLTIHSFFVVVVAASTTFCFLYK